MRSVFWIARRELASYFVSPLAYLILAVFTFVIGLSFSLNLISFANECLIYGSNPYALQQLNVNEQVVRPLFGGFVPVFFLILLPALTMRLLPEERRQGTSELILTSPVTSSQIVVGKYLGVLVVFAAMLALSLGLVFVLTFVSQPDLRIVGGLYLGVFLLGASFLAVGLCLSSFTDNQVLAYVLSVGALLVLWFMSAMEKNVGGIGERAAGFFKNLSVIEHFPDFSKGILDTHHVVYYLSMIFFSLFLAQRVVDSHRWR
ncbi:MAG TPA: ABC transporter permease subunit [Candidatus Polarisedimenticolia bacterium]|nr:ABC transporter permease subunit [Candidatus Polarisedimenticolia bacterium]